MLTPLTPTDLPQASQLLQEHGSLVLARRGGAGDPLDFPGFILKDAAGSPQGLVTFHIENGECAILALHAPAEADRHTLLEAARQAALQRNCWRLYLLTHNADTAGLLFYQQIGFHLAAVHRGALTRPQESFPPLPPASTQGVPLRDVVELEMLLRELPPPAQPPSFPLRLSRRTVYQSPWVGLYLDRVVFPNGRLIPEYHFIHTRSAVAALVENEAGELLFEYVYRYATNRMEWEIPAGGVEESENVLDTARREVLEETGYDTHAHRLVYTFNPANGSTDTRFYLIACRVGERQSEIDPGEIHSIRWMKRNEIEELILRGELQDGFTLAAVLLWWWLHLPRIASDFPG